jgi:predicted amino acid-binding ACT domain protein
VTSSPLEIRDTTSSVSHDYVNLVTISGGHHSIGGSVVGARQEPAIVTIDDHTVDVPPADHMLIVRNDDRPGMIATVAQALADAGVNIDDMHLGRSTTSGDASLMVLATSPAVPREVADALRSTDGISTVHILSRAATLPSRKGTVLASAGGATQLMGPDTDNRGGGTRPRLVVIAGPGADDDELQRSANAGSGLVHDARSEDAFADADQLIAEIASLPSDLIVCLGSRTMTAEALALHFDVPLASSRTLAPKRIASLVAAWRSGSEMRSAVMSMRIDGVRRFASEHVAITGGRLTVDGILDRTTPWSPRRGALRIRPHGIGSDEIVVHDGAGGEAGGRRLRVDCTGGEVGIRGRRHRFQRIEVEVHPSPLRQVVVGTHSRRRPVVETVPL